jgi:MYXO-CTERM domain-containing protein
VVWDKPAPVCGDGAVQEGEACDDGNAIDGDGCEASCVPTPEPMMPEPMMPEEPLTTIEDEGCTCTAAEGPSANGAWMWLAVAALFLARRRSRL